MLGRNEFGDALEANCARELDYIMSAMKKSITGYKGTPQYEKCRHKLADSIARSFQADEFEVDNAIAVDGKLLQNSPHYKLAYILHDSSVNDWDDFKSAVEKSFKNGKSKGYTRAFRALTELGDLPWDCRFELPPKQKYVRKVRGNGKGTPEKQEQVLPASTLITLNDIVNRIDDLNNKFLDVATRLREVEKGTPDWLEPRFCVVEEQLKQIKNADRDNVLIPKDIEHKLGAVYDILAEVYSKVYGVNLYTLCRAGKDLY